RERGAALRDESPVSSRTVEVDRARDQLLPRSALAEEEDGNRAIAEPFEDRDRLTNRRRAADDLIERVAGLEKLLVVAEVRVRDRELHGLLVDRLAELEPADLVVPPRSLESLDALPLRCEASSAQEGVKGMLAEKLRSVDLARKEHGRLSLANEDEHGAELRLENEREHEDRRRPLGLRVDGDEGSARDRLSRQREDLLRRLVRRVGRRRREAMTRGETQRFAVLLDEDRRSVAREELGPAASDRSPQPAVPLAFDRRDACLLKGEDGAKNALRGLDGLELAPVGSHPRFGSVFILSGARFKTLPFDGFGRSILRSEAWAAVAFELEPRGSVLGGEPRREPLERSARAIEKLPSERLLSAPGLDSGTLLDRAPLDLAEPASHRLRERA